MYIIGLAGGTGSGKSFIANKLLNYFDKNKICLIQLDSYYKDLSDMEFKDREKYNFDHPNAIDFTSLINDINKLNTFGIAEIPKYNFQTHCRSKNKKKINKKEILIIEGILSFYNKVLRNKINYKIYIDISEKIRLERRINRDINLRGRTNKSIIEQFNKTVKPMHKKYVNPTKRYADLVIKNKHSIFNLYENIINIHKTKIK